MTWDDLIQNKMTQSVNFRFCIPKIILQNLIFSDAHTSSLMISDSDSDGGDEEIIFDDDLNRQTKIHQTSGMNNGGSRQRNGIIANHNQPRA